MMPFSFEGFGFTAMIIMVAVLSANQVLQYLRDRMHVKDRMHGKTKP